MTKTKRYSWWDARTFHPTPHKHVFDYRLLLLSHTANLLPIIASIIPPLPLWYKLLLVFQTIASMYWHTFPFNNWARAFDWIMAGAMIFSTLYVLFSLNSSSILMNKIIILIPFFVVSFFFFMQFKRYPLMHSLWHISSAIMILIVIWSI